MRFVVGEDLDLGDGDDVAVVLLGRCEVLAALLELDTSQTVLRQHGEAGER